VIAILLETKYYNNMVVPQLSLIRLNLEVQRSDRSVSDPVEVWLEGDSFGRLMLLCLTCRREILIRAEEIADGQEVRCPTCGVWQDSQEALFEAYPQVMTEVTRPLIEEAEEQLRQAFGKLWK